MSDKPKNPKQAFEHAMERSGLTPEEFAQGLNDYEPPPVKNDGPRVWDLVVADMRERDRIGTEKYGTPLQAFNGRRPLVDAYQEALDLVVYLRQAIEERKAQAWPAMRPMNDPDLDEIARQNKRIVVLLHAAGAKAARVAVVYGYTSDYIHPRRLWHCDATKAAFTDSEILGWWPLPKLPEVPRG